ncbi:MAG TPA: TIGR04372 family glycosyltransferase, partial [Gemmataceae bacterium]|nr:TIGR04372 family glycosyltransferase [Gemmataceae bacterium]
MTKRFRDARRYFSDLSDDQWEALRADAFAGDPAPERLRLVVNALIYRDRSRCRWHLLPREFPPAEVLCAYLAKWEADGTLDKVRAVAELNAEDPPAWPVLDRWRRTVARSLRMVPGGRLLLVPGRLIVRTCEYVAGWFSPEARLPGWFRRGHRLAQMKLYAQAADVYTRILVVDPLNVPCRLERATAYLNLSRYDECIADCRKALSSQNLTHAELVRLHSTLAMVLALCGDAERGVSHWVEARLFQLHGPAAFWDQDDPEANPDEFEILADAHNHLAEYVINTKGDFAGAVRLYERREEWCERYRAWLAEQPQRTLYLMDDWVRLIGHLALLDLVVKATRMGWLRCEQIILLGTPGGTANVPYLDYFRPHIHVVRAARPGGALVHLANALGRRVAGAIDLPDGTGEYFCNALGLIQEAWEAGGGEPLLRLSAADRAFGEANLRAMGVPEEAWFVCLHVRSAGFHREHGIDHQAHRNADIRSYLPAVEQITRRGGWVVRLGDPAMEPFPPTPGVV